MFKEWGSSLTHEYLGSYRLEHDQSWTPVEKISEANETRKWAENLLEYGKRNENILPIAAISNEMDI